jgi:putative DNA-invertase from lambdoid prophage Rac
MSHMTRIAYYRVSTTDQDIASQRHAMGDDFDMEFEDEGVSGAVPAAERPGFASMLRAIKSMKKKPEVCVYAVDRLGRDSIDVQTTVKALRDQGVRVSIHGVGSVEGETGELVLVLMAQFAQMERNRIRARADAGRAAARASLAATGRTHKNKHGLGRPVAHDAKAIAAWRAKHNASIHKTAQHFNVSDSTVKRACVAHPGAPADAPATAPATAEALTS